MRKSELVQAVASKTGIPKLEVLVTIEAMLKEIKDTLKDGENIYIRGFGSFVLKKRASKIGQLIKEKKAITIPEHHIPSFKPAKEFISDIKKIKFDESKIKKESED